MRFAIEKRSAFTVKPPAFLCDKKIHDQVVDPLPNRPFFMAIIGSAGRGKTSMLVNLLSSKQAYRKAFHHVHVVMPPHSVASLRRNIFKNHDRMYDDLDWGTLDGIREAVVNESAEKEKNTLLVLDDVTAALKDNEIQRVLRDLIYNRRHYRLSIMILVQSYNTMPLSIRKTLSHFLIYKPRNKKEATAIFEELITLPREEAEEVMRFVFDRRYAFMFADTGTGELYKKFDRIGIHDSNAAAEDQGYSGKEAEEIGTHTSGR
jgi:KaiC/GvpD/RAD55 family RecA-like ATPase